jgi:hypothetical protein
MDLVVELKINNPDDWTLIEGLLKRLKIDYIQKDMAIYQNPNDRTTIEEFYTLLEGVDVSNYGDPVAFQREAREDVILPFRD